MQSHHHQLFTIDAHIWEGELVDQQRSHPAPAVKPKSIAGNSTPTTHWPGPARVIICSAVLNYVGRIIEHGLSLMLDTNELMTRQNFAIAHITHDLCSMCSN